jgi:CMP/dCMP kinase
MPGDPAARKSLVVAIDGPSGAGKSSVARGVAAALGLRYLDTGATYRALTWLVLATGTDPADTHALAAAAAALRAELELATDPGRAFVRVAGRDITAEIRGPDVTAQVSAVSAVPAVRDELVAYQRSVIGAGGIVVEGRDIGTVVAPRAAVKIYLTAAADERAVRRSRDNSAAHSDGSNRSVGSASAALHAGAAAADLAAVRADLERRDRLDSGRVSAPLARADDAVVLDSTDLPLADVIAAVLALVAERTGIRPPTLERGRQP